MKESNLQLDEIRRHRQLKAVEFARAPQGERDARTTLRLTLQDLEDDPSGPNPLEIALREIDYTDHEGLARRIWVLASEPFQVPDTETVRYFNDRQVLTCPDGEQGEPVIIGAGLYEGESEAEANAKARAHGLTQLVCVPFEPMQFAAQAWVLLASATSTASGPVPDMAGMQWQSTLQSTSTLTGPEPVFDNGEL